MDIKKDMGQDAKNVSSSREVPSSSRDEAAIPSVDNTTGLLHRQPAVRNDGGPGAHNDHAPSGGWIWDSITKWALYLLIFLTPLFFLPWGASPVAQNKQFLATALIAIAFIAWLAKTIASGKIVYAKSYLNWAMVALVVVWGVASFLSIDQSRSFGFGGIEPDSFLNIVKYVLAFFLVASAFGASRGLDADLTRTDADGVRTKAGEKDVIARSDSDEAISMNSGKTSGLLRSARNDGVMTAIYALLASIAVLAIFVGLKFLNINLLPWDFTDPVDFNPVGTINGLALFLGFGFVLAVALLGNRGRSVGVAGESLRKGARFRALLQSGLVVLAVILAVELLLINFRPVWWALAVAMLFLAAYSMMKEMQKIKSGEQQALRVQKLALPIVILAVSIMLLMINLPIGNLVPFSPEVSPSHEATYEISKEVLGSEGMSSSLLGSGPATFTYNYGQYRSDVINQTIFWGVRFSQGSSFVLTSLANVGVVGAIALLFVVLAFIWQTIRSLRGAIRQPAESDEAISKGSSESTGLLRSARNDESIVLAGAVLFLLVGWFLYPMNFSLVMFSFIGLGLLLASHGAEGVARESARQRRLSPAIPEEAADLSRTREISLLVSPQRTLIISLVLILLIVASVSLFYLESQKYIASLYFSSGVNDYNQTGDADATLNKIARAINLDAARDLYWRVLSQAYLVKTNSILNDPQWQGSSQAALEDLRSQFQLSMAQSVDSAKRAAQENPIESANWSNLGFIYENVIMFVSGGEDFLIDAYQKATDLEPKNPALRVDLGRARLAIINKTQNDINQLASAQSPSQEQIDFLAEQQKAQLTLAIEALNKAVELKPDYSPAHFLLAQAYTMQGDVKNAIARSADYRNLNPQDAGAAFQLGFLLYKDNQMDLAKSELERAISISQDYSNARYFLGLIYDQQGKKQAAIEQFEKITGLNPDNAEVQKILENLKNGRAALEEISPPAPEPGQRIEPPIEETGGAPEQPIQP